MLVISGFAYNVISKLLSGHIFEEKLENQLSNLIGVW